MFSCHFYDHMLFYSTTIIILQFQSCIIQLSSFQDFMNTTKKLHMYLPAVLLITHVILT
jgi:hypothetical protein